MDENIDAQIAQVDQAHSSMDSLKRWAMQQAADYRAKAEIIEELQDAHGEEEMPGWVPDFADPEEYENAAKRLDSVWQRLEAGDSSRRKALQ